MERPTLSARRFYCAFYRWSSGTASSSHLHLQHAASRRTYRVSSRSLQNQPSSPADDYSTTHRRALRERTFRAIVARKKLGGAGGDETSKWLANTPVATTAELPSSQLKAWRQVIRFRSDFTVTVEVAVPKKSMELMKAKYGEHLSGMNGDGKARIEEGRVVRHCSISIAGTFPEVKEAVASLDQYKAEMVKDYEIEMGFKVALRHWETLPCQSLEEAPVSSLTLNRIIFRRKEPLSIDADIIWRDDLWQLLAKDPSSAEFIQKGVLLPVNELEPLNKETVKRRHIHIRGTYGELFQVIQAVKRLRLKGAEEGFTQKMESLSEDMRTALRPVTSPVAVITTHRALGSVGDDELSLASGMTVSSFTTVTLGPQPIISFNIKLPSRTWDCLKSSKTLCVHLLAGTARGAAIAHLFTQRYDSAATPFHKLREMGARIKRRGLNVTGKRVPPQIGHPAVLARMRAEVMLSKSVMVGDHVVVHAKVDHVELPTGNNFKDATAEKWKAVANVGALSYAMQGYKALGQSIQPDGSTAIKEQPTEVEAETETEVDDKAEPMKAYFRALDNEEIDFDHWENTPEPTLEPTQKTLSASLQSTAANDGGRGEASIQRDEEVDPIQAYFEATANEEVEFDRRRPSQEPTEEPTKEKAQKPSPTSSSTISLAGPSSVLTTPRSYSTLTHRHHQTRRTYSSSPKPLPPSPFITDEKTATQTARDFLGLATPIALKGKNPPRTRQLQRARAAAEAAARELAGLRAAGPAKPEGQAALESEIARLETTITRSESFVHKTLARHAAEDLRRMLDEGKVDLRLTPWLESAVERGMAIIVSEARQTREAFEDKRIGQDVFALIKQKLEAEHAVLSTEAMRLRSMVEEEEEDQIRRDEDDDED